MTVILVRERGGRNKKGRDQRALGTTAQSVVPNPRGTSSDAGRIVAACPASPARPGYRVRDTAPKDRSVEWSDRHATCPPGPQPESLPDFFPPDAAPGRPPGNKSPASATGWNRC